MLLLRERERRREREREGRYYSEDIHTRLTMYPSVCLFIRERERERERVCV